MAGSLARLKDIHLGRTALVIGNGPSARALPDRTSCVEFVMNDGAKGRPEADYVVVVDRPWKLARAGRLGGVFEAQGVALLAEKNLRIWEGWVEEFGTPAARSWLDHVVTFPIETRFLRQEPLSFTTGKMWNYNGSPFVSCSIAAWLGCRRIGVIGVDMEDDDDELVRDVAFQYGRLRDVLADESVKLVRLSDSRALFDLPRADVEEYCGSGLVL